MVVRDYSKPIDAIVVEKKPVDELPTLAELRARKSPPTCLTFTADAAALRTPFRDYVLQTIFEVARKELGDRLKGVVVDKVYFDPYEPEPPKLSLGLAADIDGTEYGSVSRSISESVFKEESHWSDTDKKDYYKSIHYALLPLKV